MRDDLWLKLKLDQVWQDYFADVPKTNSVLIRFGQNARCRLASIRQRDRHDKHSDTLITMTGYFKSPKVPQYMIDITIAHELCHYVHGFASPLPKFSRFPHKGGLVDKELAERGLSKELKAQKKWLKDQWQAIVGPRIRPRSRRRRISLTSSLIRLFGL